MSSREPEIPAAVRVADIMQPEVVTVRPQTTVRELVRLLAERRIGGAPVVGEAGELVGIVTTTDVMRLAADAAETPLEELLARLTPDAEDGGSRDLLSFLEAEAWGDAESLAPARPNSVADAELEYEEYRVSDIMRPAPRAVRPTDSLRVLATVLLENRIHRAPVVEAGRLVGIVTTYDVLRTLAGTSAAGIDAPRPGP
jgi:CBS domain-containing protein